MASTVMPANHTSTGGQMITNCVEYNLFTAISRGLIGVLILLSNILTLAALTKAKKGIGQKGKLYVMSLSCADMLTSPSVIVDLVTVRTRISCLSVASTAAITEEVVWKKRMGYSAVSILTMISLGCSLASLLSMAIDRLLAISKPVFYKHHVTKFKICCLLGSIWFFYGFLVFFNVIYFGGSTHTSPERIFFATDALQVMPDFHQKYIISPNVYACILGNIIFFSVTIFYIRRMEAKNLTGTNGDSFKRTKAFMKMSGMTLLGFFILWTPYMIIMNVIDRKSPAIPKWIKEYVIRMVFSVMFSNSWINPILYCSFNKEYREAYKRLLHIKPKQTQPTGGNSNSSTATQQSRLN